jgi:uncharacterized integral membrane protein
MSSNEKRAMSKLAKAKLIATVSLVVLTLIVLASSHRACPLHIFSWEIPVKLPASVVIVLSALIGAVASAKVSHRWHKK